MVTTVVKAKKLIDGKNDSPFENMAVVMDGSRIVQVVPQSQLQLPEGIEVRTFDFPNSHILPGLIDAHTHLMFGTVDGKGYDEGPYEKVIERDSDEIMLLRAAHNTHMHLSAGVTTLRDNGARNKITFDLREGANQGLVTAPRLLLSGRPVTMTGGHFFWCNGEADGTAGARNAVRLLVKEGADHIKIMASGGGTAITDNRKASYGVEEMRAIVEEAHVHGKLTTAHCLATQSISNALDAGVDMIEHAGFIEPDGSYVFEPRVAERIANQGVYVSPTIQTGYRGRERLLRKQDITPLSVEEELRLDAAKAKCESQLEFVGKMWQDWGVKIIAGTDAIQMFGDYSLGLELHSDAGMSNMDVIKSATGEAAKGLGMIDQIGTLEVGKEADLIVVENDPLKDIKAMREIQLVIRAGREILPYKTNER